MPNFLRYGPKTKPKKGFDHYEASVYRQPRRWERQPL